MMDYLERKVSNEELQKIFKTNIFRSIFIADYPYFTSDANTVFYTDFIDENISSSNYNNQADALELSIVIHHFKTNYLDVISNIVYSRRGYWIKLLCLDWLYNFFDEVPSLLFFELNSRLSKSNNERLKTQSILNLLLTDNNAKTGEKLLKLLSKSNDHVVFYRFVNSEYIANIFTADTIKRVVDIINANITLSQSQKLELTGSLITIIA